MTNIDGSRWVYVSGLRHENCASKLITITLQIGMLNVGMSAAIPQKGEEPSSGSYLLQMRGT